MQDSLNSLEPLRALRLRSVPSTVLNTQETM
jgi:hypothetical protein